MRTLFASLLLLSALGAWGCAPGMAASVELRSAPPPPAVAFDSEPRFNYLADRGVGVIADDSFGYDMFSADGGYYMFSGGFWYRSPSVHGPFTAIESRRVPHRILDVDDHEYRWRHHPDNWHAARQDGDDHHDNGGNGH